MLSWVQGMRSAGTHTLPWQALVFARLTGDHALQGVGLKTGEAERALGFGAAVYFSIGRVLPDFGVHAIAHDPERRAEELENWATPFDTGGLYRGHIKLNCAPDTENIRSILNRSTYSNLEYAAPMADWLAVSFDDIGGYVYGSRPSSSAVPEIELSANEEQAWSWEARIPARDYGEPPLQTTKIFMKSGAYQDYKRWLRGEKYLSIDEHVAHLDRIEAILDISEDPVGSMKDYLCK